MVALNLYQTWVNLVSTGAAVTAYTGRGRSRSYKVTGQVSPFAGGRYRSISTEGTAGSQTFLLRDVTDAQVATLKSWMGQLVLVRDNRGRKMYGTYYEVTYPDRMTQGLYDVQLVVFETTYSEG